MNICFPQVVPVGPTVLYCHAQEKKVDWQHHGRHTAIRCPSNCWQHCGKHPAIRGSSTIGNVVEDSQQSMAHPTVGNVLEDTQQFVAHPTIGNVVEDTQQSMAHPTVGSVVEDTQQSKVSTPILEVKQTQHTVIDPPVQANVKGMQHSVTGPYVFEKPEKQQLKDNNNTCKFTVRKLFNSLNEIDEAIEQYETRNFHQLWKRDARTLAGLCARCWFTIWRTTGELTIRALIPLYFPLSKTRSSKKLFERNFCI